MPIEVAPAFQFYVKEWRSSRPVMRMTFAQRGMYLEMLLEQWENLTLPDDPAEVAALIGGSVEEWTAAWPVLRARFVDRRTVGRPVINADGVRGRIHNLRLEHVRKEMRTFKKMARKGGIKRALTAKRSKDGSYHPAGSPAATPAVSPAVSPGGTQPGVQVGPSTASASATASAKRETRASEHDRPVRPPRPIGLMRASRAEAAYDFGKIWVPHKTHADFLELRNGNQQELSAWFRSVGEEWSTGAKSGLEPGANMWRFWETRYAERWPASPATPKDTGPVYATAASHRYGLPPKAERS